MCKSCDCTMQCVTDNVWWCPRCGSLKMGGEHEAPVLVDRVRACFHDIRFVEVRNVMRVKGVVEAVFTPEERKDLSGYYPEGI